MIKKLGDGIKIVKNEKWDFNNNVASQFIKHANKSIPGYEMGHDLIISIAKDILPPQARILDIGCSTGFLLGTRKAFSCFASKIPITPVLVLK